jgi:oligopeptide/dipeptide ABC transporter ATP-binding protein
MSLPSPTPSANSAILHVEELKKYFPIRRGFLQRVVGWVRAVEDVTFTIQEGKTLGLVGESGCGKTTVAKLLLKLLPVDGGRIVYKGRDITYFSDKDMKPLRKEIQIIFQDPYGSLNPRMTVGQSVSEGLRIAGFSRGSTLRERLEELLQLVGMSPASIDRFPHEFSGGQRQRIGIARALSVDPSLVICDEPISALDVSIQAQIINLLKDLQERLSLSYLFISHDLNVVSYLCDQVCVMYKGHIMEYAPADMLFEDPRHPYTNSLLAAVPEPNPDQPDSFFEAPAEFVDVPSPPSGCSFQGKCPVAEPQCSQGSIDLLEVAPGHQVRCWKVGVAGEVSYVPGDANQ